MSDRDTGAATHRPLIRCGEGGPSVTPDSSRPGSLPWLEINLPAPPSVNRIIGKLGNRSPNVQKWIDQADKEFTLFKSKRALAGMPSRSIQIKCAYEAEFIFAHRKNSDLDNRAKPLMDYLQRVGLVENDRLCVRLELTWGSLPQGRVLVRLRPWMTTEGK